LSATRIFVSAYAYNRHIICPSCDCHIEIKRRTGEGATYVSDWRRVPAKLMMMIEAWCRSDDMSGAELTKVQLRHKWIAHGIPLTENAASARLSELVGIKIAEYIPGHKTAPHHTRQPPRYRLRLHRAIDLLETGGILRQRGVAG